MFQYRQVLIHMRSGQSDRQIARSGLIGRPKAAAFRLIAQQLGWLSPHSPLPADETLAEAVKKKPKKDTPCLLAQIKAWHNEGIAGTTIHQALVRNHGFTGSYSSIRRCLQQLQTS